MFNQTISSLFKRAGLLIAATLITSTALASGIQVLNTTVIPNTSKKTAQVKFTVTWDHSWRISTETTGPKNWDAAWVFIKFREVPNEDWSHGYVTTGTTGHVVPSNAELKVGTSPTTINGVSKNAGVGAFIFRKNDGNGTFLAQDVELEWNYEDNGLTGGEQVEVCVLAIEMVYVPTGSFYLGDRESTGHLCTYNSKEPINVTGETVPSYLYNYSSYHGSGAGNSDDFNYSKTLAGAFPKGHKAFYCMKHEITQGEYVQFLNKVSVAVKNKGTYYSGKTDYRHGIVKNEATGIPTSYGLKKPGDAFLPCNYLSSKDILAYLDWAALRPMTELEYEKACRGPLPVASSPNNLQYAWGTIGINNALGLSNKGLNNEGPSNIEGNCSVGEPGTPAGTATALIEGPIRAGGFATPVSSRTKAGASYWGIMELSGNLWERAVTIGNNSGRIYTGLHGNGEIGPGDNPDLPASWPSIAGAGLGFRGGSFAEHPDRARISDRKNINNTDALQKADYGGRGVRIAE